MHFDERDEGDYRIYAGALEAPRGDGYIAAVVVKEQSEKSPMARKVYASFTKFQALLAPWDQIAEGAVHQLLKG